MDAWPGAERIEASGLAMRRRLKRKGTGTQMRTRTTEKALRDHPDMEGLDALLRDMPEDRQAAFMDMLQGESDSVRDVIEEGTGYVDAVG